MKLKDLRNLAKTIRNINIALILLGIGMVLAMCIWCVLFQSDVITTLQWVTLELTTMAALSVNTFILNFFCDVNSEVRARLTKAMHKYRLRQQARVRAATVATATAMKNAVNANAEPTKIPASELQVVGG